MRRKVVTLALGTILALVLFVNIWLWSTHSFMDGTNHWVRSAAALGLVLFLFLGVPLVIAFRPDWGRVDSTRTGSSPEP